MRQSASVNPLHCPIFHWTRDTLSFASDESRISNDIAIITKPHQVPERAPIPPVHQNRAPQTTHTGENILEVPVTHPQEPPTHHLPTTTNRPTVLQSRDSKPSPPPTYPPSSSGVPHQRSWHLPLLPLPHLGTTHLHLTWFRKMPLPAQSSTHRHARMRPML